MAETETATDGETINLQPVSEQPREGREVLPASTRRMIQEELHAYEPRLRLIMHEVIDEALGMFLAILGKQATDERGDTEQENAAEAASFGGGVGE